MAWDRSERLNARVGELESMKPKNEAKFKDVSTKLASQEPKQLSEALWMLISIRVHTLSRKEIIFGLIVSEYPSPLLFSCSSDDLF